MSLPGPLDGEKDITVQYLRDTKEYTQVTENKTTVQGNLTKAEKASLKSLKKRVDQDGIVVHQTDTSGRFSLDTVGNYREACQPHI